MSRRALALAALVFALEAISVGGRVPRSPAFELAEIVKISGRGALTRGLA